MYPVRELSRSDWPLLLNEIPDPPQTLYMRGSLPKAEHRFLAVVGSRKYTNYGKDVTESLIEGLRGYPIVIVSGLALGIDSIAHEAALRTALHTIAVPGSGIDDSVLYPRSHVRLGRKILDAGGALISEFDPLFRATEWSFPQRNRIMAGISHAVLVIEAELKSGTLITARLATDYNRDVLTVPASIFSATSRGPHMLMRLGATPITGSADILEALHLEIQATIPRTDVSLTEDERKIISLLDEPKTRDELIRVLGMETSRANILLMGMELRSLIVESNNIIRRI